MVCINFTDEFDIEDEDTTGGDRKFLFLPSVSPRFVVQKNFRTQCLNCGEEKLMRQLSLFFIREQHGDFIKQIKESTICTLRFSIKFVVKNSLKHFCNIHSQDFTCSVTCLYYLSIYGFNS